MANAIDLKSIFERIAGSSPAADTQKNKGKNKMEIAIIVTLSILGAFAQELFSPIGIGFVVLLVALVTIILIEE